eukprot:6194229-Pleurochrysis_carterae.AAC.2
MWLVRCAVPQVGSSSCTRRTESSFCSETPGGATDNTLFVAAALAYVRESAGGERRLCLPSPRLALYA